MKLYDMSNIQIRISCPLGNEVLYNMCKDNFKHTDVSVIASKMWLIGRSYACSPQRRKIPNKVDTGKYGFFFDELGKKVVAHKNTSPLDDSISTINDCGFSGNFEDDIALIIRAINAVKMLNTILHDSIKELDKRSGEEKDKQRDNISFCSKYLHFHCPRAVFIYDSYSNKNASAFAQVFKHDTCLNTIINRIKGEINCKELKRYIEHYVRCYCISIICQRKSNFLSPREVDSFLLTEQWKEITKL